MKAVIVGAGIAGLVTARQLAHAGWEVVVLEQSPGPRTAGYMMDFFGPGVEAAERIGLYPRLAAASYQVDAAEYVTPDGRVTARVDYRRFVQAAGGKALTLMRPDLERAALEALDDLPAGRVQVRYDSRPSGFSVDDGGVRVEIADVPGSPLVADALIGADGIHSDVRAQLFGPEPEYLRPVGMRAAAFIVDAADIHARVRTRFMLTDSIDRTAGLYGLRTGEVAAMLVYRDSETLSGEDTTAPRDRLRQNFTGLGVDVDRVLALCPERPYDDVVAQIVMPRWRRERVILVGDASGAVSLLAGQGGSLAVAGGALLGDILGSVSSPADIDGALAEFERRWRPVVESAQASGRRAAASFLPASRFQRMTRRWILRAAGLPVINRIVARQIVNRLTK